ncbi:MAG: dihydropteroate synthase, partial [Bacteroidetes bacterium]|nr:dihydropteroate synthase [Bacteroidota bacterium]
MSGASDISGTLLCRDRPLDLRQRTAVMGVLNVTPDSFSDGGAYPSTDAAVKKALEMVRDGADIIDVGGESTRPATVYGGSTAVSAEEELRRVLPVIERLAVESDVLISIDTTKSAVADAALKAGAHIVNDISGLTFDPAIASVAAAHGAALVVMHIQGTPETMQIAPYYENVVAEVKESLAASVAAARKAGVTSIIIDPGIGFGKETEHNLSLLRHLSEFRALGCPILIGTSKKGFIGKVLGLPVQERLEGTAASVAVAVMNGASIVRVHDVKEMKRVVRMTDAIL